MTRACLAILLALCACNSKRQQCHDLVVGTTAVICEEGLRPRVSVDGRVTIVACVPKGER